MSLLKNYIKLEKLTIDAYESSNRSRPALNTFQVMFNPESYSIDFENSFSKYQGINTSSRESQYIASSPQKLSIKIVLDATGVTQIGMTNLFFGSTPNVQAQVKKFLELTYSMYKETHQPRYLTLRWGDTLDFDCRLQSVNVKFTLFDRDGSPLRAELDAIFVQDIYTKKRLLLEDKRSADLTHIRCFKEGDNLPLLAQQTYGDVSYYIKIAIANELNNFRDISPGRNLVLPPLQ